MYSFTKLKDNAINFVKNDYPMLLLFTFVYQMVFSIFSDTIMGILSTFGSIIVTFIEIMISIVSSGTNGDNPILTIIYAIVIVFFSLIVGICSSFVAQILQGLGNTTIARGFIIAKREGKVNFETLIYIFKSNFKNIIIVHLKKSITISLWTALFIIPGIVKSYELYMVDYLLAENPNLTYEEACNISKLTTDGDKINIFLMHLVCFGVAFLGILACCIGIFFVMPFIYALSTEMYYYLKEKSIYSGFATSQTINQL